MTSLYILLAVLMGVTMSVYLPMNSTVAKHFGSPITANVLFYFVGLLTTIVMLVSFGDVRTILKTKELPPYLFLTGAMSAVMVLGAIFLIPKIGARKMTTFLITGQVIMAIIVSHFGLLQSAKDPITLQKFIGAVLLVLGAMISIG